MGRQMQVGILHHVLSTLRPAGVINTVPPNSGKLWHLSLVVSGGAWCLLDYLCFKWQSFTRSLFSLILVRTVLNNFYFCSFSLLKFPFHLVFVLLQLKNSRSRSRTRKTNGNNFCFRFSASYENSSAANLGWPTEWSLKRLCVYHLTNSITVYIAYKKIEKNYAFTAAGAKVTVNVEVASGGRMPVSGSTKNGESTSWTRSVGMELVSSEFAPNTRQWGFTSTQKNGTSKSLEHTIITFAVFKKLQANEVKLSTTLPNITSLQSQSCNGKSYES